MNRAVEGSPPLEPRRDRGLGSYLGVEEIWVRPDGEDPESEPPMARGAPRLALVRGGQDAPNGRPALVVAHAKKRRFGGTRGGVDALRVLYVHPSHLFGGDERQTVTTLPLLRELGVDVVPMVSPGGQLAERLTRASVGQLVLCPGFPGSWSAEASPLGTLTLPARYRRAQKESAAAIEELLREDDFDLVYAANPFAWMAATAAARRCGVPVAWRGRNTALGGARKIALELWATANPPDLLVCAGEAARGLYQSMVPAPNDVVRDGIDLARFRTVPGERARTGRPDGARVVVGFVGRLHATAAPAAFLEMAARTACRHPDVGFLMAGDGPLRARCEQMAAARGLAGRVQFLGPLDDAAVRAFYAACDVVALPTVAGAAPKAVMEAMAMQRAMVVPDVRATTEVLEAGREGLVFAPGDTRGFSDAVERLVTSESLRAALGRAACERARDFSADRAARRLAAVLRAAVKAHARRTVPATRPVLVSVPRT